MATEDQYVLTVRLPIQFKEALEAYRRETGNSSSALIRTLLIDHWARDQIRKQVRKLAMEGDPASPPKVGHWPGVTGNHAQQILDDRMAEFAATKPEPMFVTEPPKETK